MIRPTARRAPAPLLAGASLLAAGILAGGWSVTGTGLALAAAALATLGIAAGERRSRFFAGLLALSLGFAAGRARVAVPAAKAARAWTRIDPDRPARITGRMQGYWTGPAGERSARIRAETVEQSGSPLPFPTDIQLFAFGSAPLPGVRGERLALTVSIDAPDDPVSTRDLPVPEALFRATVKSGWQARVLSTPPAARAAKVNAWLAQRLFAAPLARDTVQEPIAALLLGRTGELDREAAATLRRGGFAHVLLATGLQAALFSALVAGVLGALRVRRRAKDLLLLAAIAAFVLVAGGSPSVARVALTLSFLLGARLLELPVSPFQAIGASAIVLLAADPAEAWRFGFWLTYGASISIASLTGPIGAALRFLPPRLRTAFAVTAAAQIAAAPLVLWRFNAVSLGAWIAAPAGLPIAAALMVLGCAVLAAVAAGLPAAVPAALFEAAYRTVAFAASKLKGASLPAATPPLGAVLVLLALLAVAASVRGLPRAAAGAAYAVLFLWLALRSLPGPASPAFSIEALDVGQGDAFLLRNGRSAFLVDGGGGFSGAEDFGRARLLPKLLDRGVRSLDGVLLSHPHPDHGAGLFAVLRDLRVRAFFHGDGEDAGGLFERLDAAARESGVPVRVLRTGDRIGWGGGAFSVLRSGGRPFKKDPINNESVVLLYVRSGRRVLLTGDAGAPAETEILERFPSPPRIDVLKVGHHGSRTSSAPSFVAAFAPRAALLSCGRRNRFHHPSPETVATFSRLRIPLFRTDLRSDVGFLLTPAHLRVLQRGRP